MVGRLAREPLVHFLLLGLMLFLLYAVLGGSGADRNIRVDERAVASLAEQFERTWQRPPTKAELDALIESYVREEIFYREGLALGLDRDDSQIKKRVRQKFEVYAEESEPSDPPTDAELQAWLTAHPANYAEPAIVTFRQVLIDPARHGSTTDATVENIRTKLVAGADPATLGDSQMLPPRIDLMPLDLVERDFGNRFANALSGLATGSWQGPIRSGYGLHLVFLETRVGGRMPRLEEVRKAVARDWEADRRRRSVDAHYRDLRRNYEVEVTMVPAPAEIAAQ